jgi:hypothetical protein
MSKWDIDSPNHIFIDKSEGKTAVLFEALGAGAAKTLLHQAPFTIPEVAIDIKIEVKGNVSILGKRRQSQDFKELWDDPYMAPYTMCISSSPSEIMAQMTAMRLFLRAISMTRKHELPGVPRWHTILGGFNDPLRDAPRNRDINFLFLGNVVSDSTASKIEKLRDLLHIYGDIPKVIVTANENPIDFMSDTMKMGVNFALWLGHKRKVSM